MVLYFTGTGNSRYIAEKLSSALGDELVDMGEKIRQQDFAAVDERERLVFVVPTHAWRIPRIVESWIRKTPFVGCCKAWFVMDCGGEIGDALKYIELLCREKDFESMGVYPIVMPENYVAMFSVPDEEEARKIIQNAEPHIQRAADIIKKGESFPPPRRGLYDRFMSGAVNPIFYSLFVKADAFKAGEKCTGCGKCVKLCPLCNITLENGHPVWGKNCAHCMACICLCPSEAIEYGKKSVGKRRYKFESDREEKPW